MLRDRRFTTRLELLDPDTFRAAIPDLAALLVDAVAGGASVDFLWSLPARLLGLAGALMHAAESMAWANGR